MRTAIVKLATVCLTLLALFLTSSFILHNSSLNTAYAQDACKPSRPGPQPAKEAIDEFNKCAIQKNIFDDKIFNFNQMSGTVDSLYTLLVGESQLHPETNDATAGSGALAASGKLVSALYSVPPVSGVGYFASQIQKFNPVQPAYAQEGGIGFGALSPVQPIWTVFRNASYIGFVIIFVIIGFMVMFRAHISPQAVATVQDSIPRIVIALILVTFSYAIAGLLIDIMFLVLNIVINLLVSTGLLTQERANVVFDKSILGVVTAAWKDIVTTVAKTVNELLKEVITSVAGLNKIIGFMGGGIAGIIFGIAMLFIMFRIFIMLLMAYVTIIILTMVAPFFFLLQALPGNNGGREWFKQMASNVAVFPTVAIMIIFAGIISGIGALGGSGTAVLSDEQVLRFPLLAGRLEADAIGKLIGLGFLLMTPSAAELVKNALGVKGPQFGGAGIGALGAGAAVATAVPRSVIGGAGKEIGGRAQQAVIRGLTNFFPSLRNNEEIIRDILSRSGPGKAGGGP